MMLEIWGRRNSSNVIAVMWAVGELGLSYRRINIGGGFGGTDDPDYLRMNPNGLVPTLNDNGKVLWESNAIVRYLSQSYGDGSLWPADPYQRAQADQWMDWVKTTLYSNFMPIFFGLIRIPADQRNQTAVDNAVIQCGNVLSIPNAYLADHDWLGAEHFSMGDIPMGCMLYRYFNLDIERPSLPHLEAWFQRLCDRPAFQKHAMIPFGANLDDWQRLEKESSDIQ